MRLILDLETNGFLEELDTVHSLVLRAEDGTVHSCYGGGYKSIADGLTILDKATEIIGHNVIKFDLPALKKVYGWEPAAEVKITDTLLQARLLWPEIKDQDFKMFKRGKLPGNLIGRHSLAAWGHRLGDFKGDYKGGFEKWSPEMQAYCEQDTQVTLTLLKRQEQRIEKMGFSERALRMEHEFLKVMFLMEQHGFLIDTKKLVDLYAKLSRKRQEIEERLVEVFPPWYRSTGSFTPKRDNKKLGYLEGVEFTKVALTPFNPGSRDHVADRLKDKYAWKPTEFTGDGRPKVDDEVLKSLHYPEAQLLAEYYVIQKRIGQIAEGKQAWLKLEKGGRLHGRIETVGAVTRRCTHMNPNIAQAPGVNAPYGRECREAFVVRPGYKLVGVDASGLELRCLAHYMGAYDGGAYAKVVLDGDIHAVNQEAAGLPTRDTAKTFIYAFLYGAGDEKIGSIVGKGRKAGKQLKADFLSQTPALKILRERVDAKAGKTKTLKTIDGGVLPVRHKHAALNTLLQSAGAIAVKQATVFLWHDLSTRGWKWGEDYAFCAHVHDEIQAEVREELVDEYAKAATSAIRVAGEQLGFKCSLDGDWRAGDNWAETH